MSVVFLSHSSTDDAIAAEVSQRLCAQGYRSVFLDFDPEHGVPAGRDWERELYAQLRACRAVIVLCSEHSMSSRWCFAEITNAKFLGKHIFPLKVGPCKIDPVLTSRQTLDLTRDAEEAYGRLWRGLKVAGLDPTDSFNWKADRPPYPGLLAFKEEDAAVFFGRDAEIQQGLEALQRLRQFGGARVLLVLGASGSGKSSLVRAGLLPRLRRDRERWLVVDPFRPRERPLRELAIVLAKAFGAHGHERDWEQICASLEKAADAETPTGDTLNDLVLALQVAADRREATVLLVVDQTEELLAASGEREATGLMSLLRAALEQSTSFLMVLCTLRSDFLGDFQQHPAIRDLGLEDVRVGPMAADRLVQVIEGPARVAGIELEAGLPEVMVKDTETEGALPLLAFTLRELYERFSDDKKFTVAKYRDKLGGLSGSVARAADAVLAAERLSKEREEDLRTSFLSLVRINEEGQFTRRPARWTDLPESVHSVLERFVQARLLTSRGEEDERILEVAHEALFRSWVRLEGWLDEDREFLLWRKRVSDAQRAWEDSNYDEGALLRGGPLAEAERWSRDRGKELWSEEQRLINESVALRERESRKREESEAREKEALKKRAEEARKRARRAIHVSVGLFLGVLLYISYQISVSYYPADPHRSRYELCTTTPDRLDGCSEHSLIAVGEAKNEPIYKLAILQLDRDGLFTDRKQMQVAVNELYESSHTNDILIVVFVHGWNHSADSSDKQLRWFEAELGQLSQMETAISRERGARRRDVLGIYVTWPAATMADVALTNVVSETLLARATFPSHRLATQKVAQGDIAELLTRVDQVRSGKVSVDGSGSDTRLITMGQGFGADILFYALSNISVRDFIIGRAEFGFQSTPHGFGNLMVLLNPTFSASHYLTIHANAVSRGNWFSDQLPIMSILTSKVDEVSKIGLGTGFWSGLVEKSSQSQLYPVYNSTIRATVQINPAIANEQPVGKFAMFRTHYLRAGGRDVSGEETASSPEQAVELIPRVREAWQKDAPGSNISFGGSVLERTETSAGRNPFLVIAVDAELMKGHDEITEPRLVSFINQFIQISRNP